MTLKALRRDLSEHLAAGLGVADSSLGAQVNSPAIIVQSGDPYLTPVSYCQDAILFAVTLTAPPGDPPAVADALDDLIDGVRSTLKAQTINGNKFSFRELSGFTTYGDSDLPAVVVTVAIDRSV